jgi:hypothetical protein
MQAGRRRSRRIQIVSAEGASVEARPVEKVALAVVVGDERDPLTFGHQ